MKKTMRVEKMKVQKNDEPDMDGMLYCVGHFARSPRKD